jgi:hypothetical protein
MHNQLYNNDSCKAKKKLNGVVCTGAYLCLRTKESWFFYASRMLTPKAPTCLFLLDVIDNPNAE